MRMPAPIRDRKVPTNVTVRADLVRRAKRLGLNLSGLFEDAIERAVIDAERKAWVKANEEAIDAYNAHVAKHGVFSDSWRRF